MPTYQPNIPTGSVPLDQDYLNLQGNFQQLNIAYGVDHVPYTDTSGIPPGGITGMHKEVHLVPMAAPAAISGYGQLFCTTVNDSITTDQELFYLTGGGLLIQLTRNFQPVVSSNGYTFLAGGLMMQWGVVNSPGGSGQVLFATSNINFSTSLFSVQLTLKRKNAGIGTPPSGIAIIDTNAGKTFDKTQFNYLISTTGSDALLWVALGN